MSAKARLAEGGLEGCVDVANKAKWSFREVAAANSEKRVESVCFIPVVDRM